MKVVVSRSDCDWKKPDVKRLESDKEDPALKVLQMLVLPPSERDLVSLSFWEKLKHDTRADSKVVTCLDCDLNRIGVDLNRPDLNPVIRGCRIRDLTWPHSRSVPSQ